MSLLDTALSLRRLVVNEPRIRLVWKLGYAVSRSFYGLILGNTVQQGRNDLVYQERAIGKQGWC